MQMIQGEMRLHYRTPEGQEKVAIIPQCAIIYTPAGTPHSPRFAPDAFALISERKRREEETDRFPSTPRRTLRTVNALSDRCRR
jgi:3-hydroxyanthranilate 3,4-dioxygenase